MKFLLVCSTLVFSIVGCGLISINREENEWFS